MSLNKLHFLLTVTIVKFLLTGLMLLGTNRSMATDYFNRDSLYLELKRVSDIPSKVDLYNQISYSWYIENLDSLYAYAQKASQLAGSIDYERGIAKAQTNFAIYHYIGGDFRAAIASYIKGLEIFETLQDSSSMLSIYSNIANVYSDQGYYQLALDYYLKSLEALDPKHDLESKAMVETNIGIVLSELGRDEKALAYLYESSKVARSFKNLALLADISDLIGSAYLQMGQLDSAESNYRAALEINKQLKDLGSMCYNIHNLGLVNFQQNDIDQAEIKFNESLTLSKKLDYVIMEGYNNQALGDIARKKGQYPQAEAYYLEGIRIGEELGSLEILNESYTGLSDLRLKQGRFQDAMEFFTKADQLGDSISNLASLNKISELEIQYETKEKAAQIELLTQTNTIQKLRLGRQNLVIIGIVILAGSFMSFLFLYSRQTKIQAKQKEEEIQQKLLRTQMNPHFLFNALVSIENFIYKNEPKKAGRFLSKFASLMRLILDYSRQDKISIAEELKILDHYLTLQKLRLKDKFDYVIEVDPSLNLENNYIPPMLTQPFIENSLEHGFRFLEAKGLITISFRQCADKLVVSVEDNGMGISNTTESTHKAHKSLAHTITRERLAILNRKRKIILLEITDVSNEKLNRGTKAIFTFLNKPIHS